MLKGFKQGKCYVTLGKSFHADLIWWRDFSKWFNGVVPIVFDTRNVYHTSLSGYGAVCSKDWICDSWTQGAYSSLDLHKHCDGEIPPIEDTNINVLELYPV